MAKFEGKLIIFTAPSGAGKTTLVNYALSKYDVLDFSVSATTRERREHEQDGKDYHFMTSEEFSKGIKDGLFMEWEEVYKNQYYGTMWSEVNRIWEGKKHCIMDMDVRGAINIKDKYKDKCYTIFIKPPSIETLISRLTSRGTEDVESLKKRINRIKNEMTYEQLFDDVIVNDDLEVAKKEAEIKVETFLFGKPR